MTLEIRAIPFADDEPPDAAPTRVLTGLVAPRPRRSFLKAMAYGALTFGAAALAVPFLGRARQARAEANGVLSGYDNPRCADAYPGGYDERSDTHGMYKNEQAACFGGRYMGWPWCTSDGWHRSDKRVPSAPPGWLWECWPVSGVCGKKADNKNAWRWTTPDNKVWRCSDGNSKVTRDVWWDSWHGPYLSICRARVG
jgi:hypothetical protein